MEEDDFEKNGERMFLKEEKGYELIQGINELLDTRVKHQRITDFGEKTKIRTIIREEGIKLGQFLKGEKSNLPNADLTETLRNFKKLYE